MSEDFHIDLTEVEDNAGGSFEPIPNGTYRLQAEDWEQKVSQANNKYIKVQYRICGGENYVNRVLWENFTLNNNVSLSRIKAWVVATGGKPGEYLNKELLDGLIFQEFDAKIEIEKGNARDDGTFWPDSNKITSFLRPKITEAMPAKKEPVAEATTQQVSTATGNAISNWDE